MPAGKAAGVRCVQVDDGERCRLFGHPDRPPVCTSLQASADMCGTSRAQAIHWIDRLEQHTQPGSGGL
jgi:hypothetical protein